MSRDAPSPVCDPVRRDIRTGYLAAEGFVEESIISSAARIRGMAAC